MIYANIDMPAMYNMQSYKQIGNSVVVQVIYAIGNSFIEYL